MTARAEVCDVAIVGGGLVGASLAVALAPSGLKLTVVEAVAVDNDAQPSFDARTIALTHNARRIFSGMNVWREIEQDAHPIREIHVSERGRFGMTHLHCDDIGLDALGYVLPSRVLGRALHENVARHENVSLLCPATVDGIDGDNDDGGDIDEHRLIRVSQDMKLRAKLIVVADGGRSNLATQLGIRLRQRDYSQQAIVAVVDSDRDHADRAFERFTAEGPLALLPCGVRRYALVWTSDAENVAARMALADDEFIQALQDAFGERAGNFIRASKRKKYPLQFAAADYPTARRAVLIGNAAHRVHPVAGQGFNLGLRDVAVLAELLDRAHGERRDVGDAALLDNYAHTRRDETRRVGNFTDGLIGAFANRRQSIALARNLALAGIELCPPAKRFLLRRTMGIAGKTSRLGAGLALRRP